MKIYCDSEIMISTNFKLLNKYLKHELLKRYTYTIYNIRTYTNSLNIIIS